MTNRLLAILIPANPYQYSDFSEEKDRSDIGAHMRHAELSRGVYWNVPASGRKHTWFDRVRTAYFVSPSTEAPHRCNEVVYKGEILSIQHYMTKDNMRARFPVDEVGLLYGTRRKVLEIESEGGYSWSRWPQVEKYGFIFLKVRSIRLLAQRHEISEFRKALWTEDGPVRICRKYVIVYDEFFE